MHVIVDHNRVALFGFDNCGHYIPLGVFASGIGMLRPEFLAEIVVDPQRPGCSGGEIVEAFGAGELKVGGYLDCTQKSTTIY